MSLTTIHTERYAHCINHSRRVRWDIDRDVIRDRRFDFSKPFLVRIFHHWCDEPVFNGHRNTDKLHRQDPLHR